MCNLSPRLKIIADMVTTNSILDVGTDHGKLPVYLIKSNKISKAVASDLNSGPLTSCKKNIKQNGLNEKIQTVLSNGLENINPPFPKTLCVAGMGGELIIKILSDFPEKVKKFEQIILQPMTNIVLLKAFLFDNGYIFTDERLCEDSGKIYDVFSVKYTGESQGYREVDLWISPIIINKKDSLINKYAGRLLGKFDVIVTGLKKSDADTLKDIKKYESLIDEVKKIYETSKNY